MVEEKFKIDIDLEVTPDSLADLSRQIQKNVKAAFDKATAAAAPAGKAAGPVPGGAATVRSAKETLGVSGKDFAKQVAKELAKEQKRGGQSFDEASKRIVAAVDALRKAMETRPTVRPGPKPPEAETRPRVGGSQANQFADEAARKKFSRDRQGGAVLETKRALTGTAQRDAPRAGQAKTEARSRREFGPRGLPANQLKDNLAIMETQRTVAAHVQKTRNQANQAEVAAAKQARREREAGAKAIIAAGGGAGPPGGPPRGGGPGGPGDPPRGPKQTPEAAAVAGELKRVTAEAKTVSGSLSELRARIEKTPGLGSIEDIFKQIGLPKGAEVGGGATVEIKKLSGEAKTATGYIEIFGNKVKGAGNIVNKRIQALLGSGRIEEIGKTARHRPQRAVQEMRREVEGVMNLPTADKGAMAGYQRGGVKEVTMKLTKEQQEVINGLSSEAERLAAANEMLHKFVSSLSQAQKALLGIEKLSSVGLSEETAAKMTTMREEGEGGRPGKIKELQFAAQSRDIAGMGLGGAGAMREARSFLVTQAQEIKGGGPPEIMGGKERALYEQGLIKPAATKTLRTAIGETGKDPQTAEDQFLIDKSVVMDITQFTSKTIPKLAEGLKVGSKLVDEQVLGKDVEGEDITFDAKGVNAEIDTVEKVVKNGIEMWRVRIKEINQLVTGAKITTGSGMKGVVMRADLEKRGYPKGTEAVMSAEGMAKRGVLKDPMMMMSSEIAKQVGASGQEVANKIEAAMREGGQDLETAVKGVAEQFGLKGFTGATKLPEGPLKAAGGKEIMTGDLPFYRLPKLGQTGPTEQKDVFYDAPGMQAAGTRAETAAWVEDARKAMDKFASESQDFIQQLLAMTGATEAGAEGLRKVKPEEFKRLPQGADLGEAFEGTIADVKQFGDALEVMLPARGGGETAMRIPGMGKALGQRETFKTPEGMMQTSGITNVMDRIMETGTGIKAARGDISLDEDMESLTEAAHMATRAMQEEIQAIQKMGWSTEEGAAAAEGFVAKFMPVIKMLQGPVGLQYERLDKGGKAIGKPIGVKGTAEEYVSGQRNVRGQALAVRDVLAQRAETVSGKPGRQTRSVAREGEVFRNAEVLGKTLESLGVTMDDSSAHVQKLHDRLEVLQEQLLQRMTALGPGTVSGGDPRQKRLAQQKGAGTAPGGFQHIVSLPTDVTKELENVRERLISMRDAGANVSASLEALDRMMSVQREPAIARDAVVLNREDYKKLTEKVRTTAGVGEEEAKGLMKRGVLHRFPTTGGASFRPVKIQEDVEGMLPAGKMAVAAPMAVSSPEDLAQMLAPLKASADELYDTIRKTGGVGQAAEKARAELNDLVPTLEMLQASFLSAGENADFDGDMESIHAAVTKKSADSLQTFTEQVRAGGVSFKNMMTNIIGAAGTKGGMGGVGEYSKLFAKTAKLREGPFQAAVLAPQTAEQTGKEAFAHTAGKLNIGIATDAFNKAATAVMAGSGQMGDAFATGVEMFNLQLNKALATKHGGAGGAGGLGLIEDLRKGQLGKISKGMKKGGSYEDLGDFNKDYRAQMEKNLMRAGPEGVRDIAKAEGIEDILPKDLTAENFMGSVKKMVDALDLNGIFARMFEMMKANMIRALKAEGKTLEEIDDAMKTMLTRGQRGVPGLDLDKIVGAVAPGQAMSRRKAAKEMGEKPPMEQGREIIDKLIKDISGKAVSATEEGAASVAQDGDQGAAAKRIAGGLRTYVMSWYESLGEGFEEVSQESLGKRFGATPERAQKIRGAYGEGPGVKRGEGKISIGENVTKAYRQAMEELKSISEGDWGDPSTLAARLKQVGVAIKDVTGVVGHEGIHKGSRRWQTSVTNLVRGLEASGGKIGPQKDKIIAAIDELGGTGFAKLKGDIKALEDRLASGLTTTKVAGQEEEVPIAPVLARKQKALMRGRAEELMAYQADQPEALFGKLREKGVDEGAIGAIQKNYENLMERPTTDIAQKALQTGTHALNAFTDGLLSAAQNVNVGKVRKEAETVVGGRMQSEFAGREQIRAQIPQLMLGEKAIQEGRVAMGIPEQIEMPRGMDPQAEYATQIKELLERSQKEFAKPGDRRGALRDLEKATREYSKDVSAAQKADPSARPGVKGFQEAQKAVRQFQANSQQVLVDKAKMLLEAVKVMREGGETDSPRFIKTVQEFFSAMGELQGNMQETLRISGRGRGGVTSNIATREGVMVPAAQQMGMRPDPGMYKSIIAQTAGTGKEEQARFKHMQAPLEAVHESIKEGGDATKEMTRLWDALISQPESFRENLYKVIEVLGKFSKEIGFTMGQFAKGPQDLQAMTKSFKTMFKAIEGEPLGKGKGGIERALGAKPAPKREMLKAKGGGLAESIDFQYKEAIRIAEARAAQLEKVIGTDAFKKMGAAGRHFEPLKFDIIDPKTGQVVQKLESQFKKTGKVIKTTMKQSGAAAAQFGTQMRQAFRRVVQWGFASGIIYGTIRAMRQMVQTITEVETKMANLAKVMDTSITDFGAMQEAAVSMAKNFGIAIDEVLDGMVVYAQQGLKMGEIMERTRATLTAVNVTTLTSKEATEALTAVMKLFSSEVGDSMGAVDAWAAVAAKHAITAKDLAMAVQRSGAAARTAGVSFEDFLGITTAIGAVTRQTGKEVATSTKFMFRAMRRPTAQKQLLGMNIKTQDVTGDLRPAMDVLGELAGKWGALSRAQKLSTAQAMAGIRHYNSFIILMENFGEVLDASADAADSQGFAIRKQAIVLQTFAKQMQILKGAVTGFALDLGKVIVPAMTGLVSLAGKVVGAFELLPDVVKQVGVGMAIGLIVVHKSLDMVLDSLDAITGMGTAKAVEKGGGLGPAIGKGLKRVPGMVKSASASFINMGSAILMSTNNINQFSFKTGSAAEKIMFAKAATFGWAKSLKALQVAMLATGILAIGVAIGTLVAAFMASRESAKEFEDSMFDTIGRSEDATQAFIRQESSIRKLSHAWSEYEAASEAAQDPERLKESVDAGTYKSPLSALKKYNDMVADTGLTMAKLSPESISGISETGEYITEVAEGFSSVSASAADAQRATTAALQTKVIQAYAKELTEAVGFWDTLAEYAVEVITLSFGELDMSPAAKIKDVREQINELATSMDELAEQGISPAGMQEDMNMLVGEELELREQMVGTATELKRVLDKMPAFGSPEIAKMALGPKLREAVGAAIPTGVFGRDATEGSVMMGQFAKSTGLGGLVGGESTAEPVRLMQELLEKGIRGIGTEQLKGTRGGALAVVDEKGAAALLAIHNSSKALARDADKTKAAIEGARTLVTTVDEITGEIIYHFDDGMSGLIRSITESELNKELTKAGAKAMSYDRTTLEQAAERTRKLLTLQYVGALAGIRIPEGGMPDLGPARARDLTVEQRVLGSETGDEMERLAEIQREMTEIQRKYNEELSGSEPITENAASALKENINVLKRAQEDLVMALQMEAFDLAQVGHMESALQNLSKTMEDAAYAARDAAIEEEARAELLTHTSGALAGLSVAPNIDFGKSLKELTAGERLQKEMGPGFGKTLARIAGLEKRRDAGVETVINIRKQMADFNEMISDLGGARGKLGREQELRKAGAAAKGITEGEEEMATQVQDGSDRITSAVERQTPILNAMLNSLNAMEEVEARGLEGDEKREFLRGKIGEAVGEQLLKTIGAGGQGKLRGFFEDRMGLKAMSKEERGERGLFDSGRIMGERYKEAGATFGMSDDSKKMFEDAAGDWIQGMSRMDKAEHLGRTAGKVGTSYKMDKEMALKQINEAQAALLAIPEVAEAAKKYASAIAANVEKDKVAAETLKSEEKILAMRGQLIEMRKSVLEKFNLSEQKAIADTEEAARILQVKEGFRMAMAVQGLADGIRSTIDGFEKAEMLFYDKLDSDLEGAFARVGRAGFRTEFEQRELDVQEKYGQGGQRPMSYDEMRSRDKELAAIEFDEKEAKIKQTQDKETAALRLQQKQAEDIRNVLADTLMDPGMAGTDAGMMSKQYLDVLTDQLAESEQATLTGDTLSFKGVPALEDARNFLAKIQEQAKATAQKANKEFLTSIGKASALPTVTAIESQTGVMQTGFTQLISAVESMGGHIGEEGEEGAGAATTAAGTRAALGMAATGTTPVAGAAGMSMALDPQGMSMALDPQGMSMALDPQGMSMIGGGPAAAVNAAAAPLPTTTAEFLGAEGIQGVSTPEQDAARKAHRSRGLQVASALKSTGLEGDDLYKQLQAQGYSKDQLEAIEREDFAGRQPDLGQGMGKFGGMEFYKGESREYNREVGADAASRTAAWKQDYQVQEGTFKTAEGLQTERLMQQPYSDAEKLKTIAALDARSAPTQSFRPTGMFRDTDPSKTLAFSDQDQVGMSNTNQVLNAQRALQSGDRASVAGAVQTTDRGIPGVDQGRDPVQDGGGGATEAQATASQEIASAIEGLNATLGTLTQQGISLPADVTTALTGIGGAVTDALTSVTLSVDVNSSVPIDLSTSTVSALGAEIASQTGGTTGAVGAEITVLGTRLDVIEGFAGEGGVLDEQVDQAILDTQTNIPILIDELTTTVADLEAADAAAETQLTELTDIATDFAALETTVADFQTDTGTIVASLGTTVAENTANIVINSQRIDQIVVRTDAIPPLEDDVAVLKTSVRDLNVGVTNNENEIQSLREIAARACSIAENAQNISRRI